MGWVIGVMVELPDAPAAVRHFFAVGKTDRAQSEWSAIDRAMLLGGIASSPVGGLEPVHVVKELSPPRMAVLGLKTGEIRPLGVQWPRRWVSG